MNNQELILNKVIAVRNISQLIKSTHDENVLGQIGGFGGLFDMAYFNSACLNPVLVTSIDGVEQKVYLQLNIVI